MARKAQKEGCQRVLVLLFCFKFLNKFIPKIEIHYYRSVNSFKELQMCIDKEIQTKRKNRKTFKSNKLSLKSLQKKLYISQILHLNKYLILKPL